MQHHQFSGMTIVQNGTTRKIQYFTMKILIHKDSNSPTCNKQASLANDKQSSSHERKSEAVI